MQKKISTKPEKGGKKGHKNLPKMQKNLYFKVSITVPKSLLFHCGHFSWPVFLVEYHVCCVV